MNSWSYLQFIRNFVFNYDDKTDLDKNKLSGAPYTKQTILSHDILQVAQT